MTSFQTKIIALSSLSDIIDAFTTVLEAPAESGVAHTEAQRAVLGNVRAAYINQRQIPIPADTSAAHGAFIALQHAADTIAEFRITLDGDHLPDVAQLIADDADDAGRLNPMRLFELEDLVFGLFPISAVAAALRSHVDSVTMSAVPEGAIALVIVEEATDWDTWMSTFAR